jgi:hypothetical protein
MKHIIYIAIAALLVIFACKKDDETPVNIVKITDEVEAYRNHAILRGTIDCSIPTSKLEVYVYTMETTNTPMLYTPTIANDNTFELNLTELTLATTYYYRYIVYSKVDKAQLGQKKFTTKNFSEPYITTTAIEQIGMTHAICGGEVIDDGGYTVTARGICWSTTELPTIANSHSTEGTGLGFFSSNIINLESSTTYYVRAYATNEKGTAYGEQKIFTTTDGFPIVTTAEVRNISSFSAILGGNVVSDNGFAIIARGVCWSTSARPTTTENHISIGTELGEFSYEINNLTDSITYYVRAYATNQNGTAYGEEKVFTTKAYTAICNHEYVDLGLPSGLKWATCNIGAVAPEDYGNYYAWAEITTKTEYTETNSLTYLRLFTEDISGNSNYDAATANWCDRWRIPTETECEELINTCTWIYTTKNGTNGYIVIGPNGKSIFLPSAGCYSISPIGPGSCGQYWTSTPDTGWYSDIYSHVISFDSDKKRINLASRDFGRSIRPVSQ